MRLAVGTLIGERWQVQRSISGGPVAEAKGKEGDVVARLAVLPCAAPDGGQLAALTAKLTLPGLADRGFPALLGTGYDGALGALWIARAWSPFESLQSWRLGSEGLSADVLGAAVTSVGTALIAAHSAGAHHGRLRPERTLLADPDGTKVEVLDLGLAELAGELGVELAMASPYAAPEGGRTAAGDVFALGELTRFLFAPLADDSRRLAPWLAMTTAADPAARPLLGDALGELATLLPSTMRSSMPSLARPASGTRPPSTATRPPAAITQVPPVVDDEVEVVVKLLDDDTQG